ncbi:hypothetical protein ACH4SP_14245 [Streptomyces sp. NPDC021093]|uniref:hypothetical protein n=1 Tax=Streptomyces sp. NPDC021093 TaxID=3365112 RepID=UPI0037AA1848
MDRPSRKVPSFANDEPQPALDCECCALAAEWRCACTDGYGPHCDLSGRGDLSDRVDRNVEIRNHPHCPPLFHGLPKDPPLNAKGLRQWCRSCGGTPTLSSRQR